MGLGLKVGFSCFFTLWLTLILFSSFTFSSPVFFESFDKPWKGHWVPSEKEDYQGKWKHERNDAYDDYGLLVSQAARKYAIVVNIPKVHFKDDPVVLQYDLKAQNGLVCGGAYLKYLVPQNAGWDPKHFDNDSPFSIMFGPDKCGATNKVHFIFRHKNPKTDKYVEHNLKYSPLPKTDKVTHVYTAVIHPNNTLKILIDGEEKKTANLLSGDFDPPLLPPMTIPDPDDKKPEDWDECVKIPHLKSKKPDKWDEDAAKEIEDLDAKNPEGWLEDEPKEIDDRDSPRPDDWDDEKDGKWKTPKITNPKCEEAPGCGEWKMPFKRNPNYKGKWHPPMIDNSNCKGFWKPRNIPNPTYFELKHPNMEAIAAIGIEIWTMQDGLLFDNILIANDVSIAQEYRDKYWKPKFEADKEKQGEEKDVDPHIPGMLTEFKGKVFDFLYKIAAFPLVAPYKTKIIDLIQEGEKAPNLTIGIFVSIFGAAIMVIQKIIFGGKKILSASFEGKEEGIPEQPSHVDKVEEPCREIEKEQDVPSAPRHRKRRET